MVKVFDTEGVFKNIGTYSVVRDRLEMGAKELLCRHFRENAEEKNILQNCDINIIIYPSTYVSIVYYYITSGNSFYKCMAICRTDYLLKPVTGKFDKFVKERYERISQRD